MTLAEALVIRADTKKRIEQVRERLKLSALVQEGEQPPENPQELLTELERLLAEFEQLVQRINRTNLSATLPDGRSLTAALAERDRIALHHGVIQSVADAATPKADRLGRAEIKKLPTIKVSELRKQLDQLAHKRRDLDLQIQAVNWKVELAD